MNAVILAGGSGTRLWPLSRESRPKQFLALGGEESLLQQTWSRLRTLLPADRLYVCTTADFVPETLHQLPELDARRVIVEPMARGTGPASALISAWMLEHAGDQTVATLAADAWIRNPEEFTRALNAAFAAIDQQPDAIVTVGIRPTRPSTGFGYIRVGGAVAGTADVHHAEGFEEKPDQERAQRFLDEGCYLWNASYFVYRPGRMLSLFADFQPEIAARARQLRSLWREGGAAGEVAAVFGSMAKISIDKAVMERAQPMLVVPAALDWNDLGTWDAVYEVLSDGTRQVVARGRHLGVADEGCLVFGGERLVATLGLANVAIIDTPDALLVCSLEHAQEIKQVIDRVRASGQTEVL